jgi:outer membrane immunogenic protein
MAPPVPVYDWGGFYIGVNGGYGWQENRPDLTVMNQFGTLATTTGLSASGGFGGGQAGYNWQRGIFVFGLEADIQGADITDGFTARTVDTAGDLLSSYRKIDYFGTVRGRIGLASNNWLFYATGGFAYADVKNNLFVTNATATASATLNSNAVQTGYAAGAGIEYAFNPSWSIKAEYQYIGLGGYILSAASVPPGTIITSSFLRNDFQTVRIGINYKWGAPVVAKY